MKKLLVLAALISICSLGCATCSKDMAGNTPSNPIIALDRCIQHYLW